MSDKVVRDQYTKDLWVLLVNLVGSDEDIVARYIDDMWDAEDDPMSTDLSDREKDYNTYVSTLNELGSI